MQFLSSGLSFLSPEFGLFLAVGLVLFYAIPLRWRWHVLLGLSYIFYLAWVPFHALLLLGTTAVVYGVTRAIDSIGKEQVKLWLAWTVAAFLVALMAFLKCLPLFAQESFLVPLGLSYYFFKLISYLLDVYWGKVPCQRNFLHVALYVSFFPQIVSGPIQRSGAFFAQLQQPQRPAPSQVVIALRRILLGFFKKLVIAQRFGLIVDRVYENPAAYSSLELLLTAYFFAFQLYTDFSGLTDIAIGVGQLFGITGPENFDRPFFARNLQEYWRRWHMSLTSWLADYLFQPLRLSLRRFGQVGLVAAIFLNMVAIGIWHGPRWTYALFGAVHGVMLSLSVLTLRSRNMFFKNRPRLTRLRAVFAPLVTFHLVVFGLIIFRSESLSSTWLYFKHAIPGTGLSQIPSWRLSQGFFFINKTMLILILGSFAAVEWVDWTIRRKPPAAARFDSAPRLFRWAVYYACIVAVFLSSYGQQQFLYAKF
jgi:alginate O-acetyltransferase complex protein AlgI